MSLKLTVKHLGIRGIFTSRYVFVAAAFATLGGTLFGYE